MKRLLLPLLLVFMSIHVFALEINVISYPSVVHPGDTTKIIVSLVGNAKNVEVKVDDPVFDPVGKWIDLEDVSGAATAAFYLSLPKNLREGVYYIPFLFKFEEGGETFRQYSLLELTVERGGMLVNVKGDLKPYTKSTVKVTIENKSAPLHSVYVKLVPSLDSPKYVELLGKTTLTFTAIPSCRKGIEELNLIIKSLEGTRHFTVPVICRSLEPLSLRTDLPRTLKPGYHEINIYLTNNTDLPKTARIVISSNTRIGGYTTKTVSIGARSSVHLKSLLEVEDDYDSVEFTVTVYDGNVPYTWKFSSVVSKSPEIVAYLQDILEKHGKNYAVIGVANVGEGEAKNVLVRWERGIEFVGSLDSGDYESVEVPMDKNTLEISVIYTYLGKEHNKQFSFNVRKESSNNLWLPLILILAAVIIIIWVKRRDRTHVTGS